MALDIQKDGEIQDAHEIGKNFTGVTNPGFFDIANPARPFRYGFVLLEDASKGLTLISGEQVVLPFPPNAISIDEPAATTITFTQNSGKWIERQGQLSKTITISGTTGYRPTPGALTGLSAADSVARSAIPKNVIIDMDGPTSGMARFLYLRRLFRKYWNIYSSDEQKNVELRQKAAFIFINEKDDETWLVEPINFRMTRQSPANKYTYNYEIVMQTIAPVENVSFIKDPLTLLEKILNIVALAGRLIEALSNAIALIGNVMIAVAAAVRAVIETILGLVQKVIDSLALITTGAAALGAVVDIIRGHAAAGIECFNSALERYFDIRDEVAAQAGEDTTPLEVDFGLTIIQDIFALLSPRDELYVSDFSSAWTDVLANYSPIYGFNGYNETLADAGSYSGVREVEILPGDDLTSIALREAGDAERFMELVTINNLKPPYISPSSQGRAPNTLAPGDKILIPAPAGASGNIARLKTAVYNDPTFTGAITVGGSITCTLAVYGKYWRANQWRGFTAVVVSGLGVGQERKILSNTADTFTVDKTWTTVPNATSVVRIELRRVADVKPVKAVNEQLLGVDLMVNKGNDLVISPSGDLRLVSGTNNMVQAIEVKMKTKPNDLVAHPSFGLSADPGFRGNADNLVTYRAAVRQALLSDKRIAAVKSMTLSLERDIVSLEGYLVTVGNPQPLAISTLVGG